MSKNKQTTITAKEIHKRAEDALRNDKLFEYECIHDGRRCVWNSYLEGGYAVIIPLELAREMERLGDDLFYLICGTDDDTGEAFDFSEDYDYYKSELDGKYYAVCIREVMSDGKGRS